MPRIDLIKLRRGTEAEWFSANPTLANGEYGFETDTRRSKIGDGTTAWNDLDYLSVPVTGTLPPIENIYTDITELLANQGSQTEGFLQKVTDASGDDDVNSGRAYYLKTDASTASLDDYIRQTDDIANALDAGQGSETADCGTVIPLDTIYGHNCNMQSANSNTSYTVNNENLINSYARVKINASSEPTVSGATQQGGIGFVPNTDMILLVQNLGDAGLVYSFNSVAINTGEADTLQTVTDRGGLTDQNMQILSDAPSFVVSETTTFENSYVQIAADTNTGFLDIGNSDGHVARFRPLNMGKSVDITFAGEDGDLTMYSGTWNASTNSPTLANTDTGVKAVEYKVSVAGTQDFGAGSITFAVGDIVANDGSVWYKKVDNNQGVGTQELTIAEIAQKILNPLQRSNIKLIGDSITAGQGGTGWNTDGEEIYTGVNANDGTSTCWANSFVDYITNKFSGIKQPVGLEDSIVTILDTYTQITYGNTNTYRFANTDTSDAVEVDFYGTGIDVVYSTGTNCGIVDVYIDGVYNSSIDSYTDPFDFNLTHEITGLSETTHTLKIVQTNTRNASATDNRFHLTGFLPIKIARGKNYGISGLNSSNLYKNIASIIESDDDLVICQIGTNDRALPTLSGLKTSLKGIKEYTDSQGMDLILMIANPTEPSEEVLNTQMSDVANAIISTCNQLGIGYINNYQYILDYCRYRGVDLSTLLNDGLHPNDTGYQIMFESVMSAMNLPRLTDGLNYDGLGNELITNGTFDTDTDWTKQASWAIGSGTANYDAINTADYLQQAVATTVGNTYRLKFDISGLTGGDTAYFKGQLNSTSDNLIFNYTNFNNGSYEYDITVSSVDGTVIRFTALNSGTGGAFSIDNVSLKQVN